MAKPVFISDVISITERPHGHPASVLLDVEVETERGLRVLTLSTAVARQLHASLEHILKG
jgi:hypothetical protein